MAFRKWLLVLAVMALVAVPVCAQSCTVTPGNPSQIRSGGLTELVGDLVLDCRGGNGDLTANLQVFLQGAVVSNRVRTGGNFNPTTPQCPFAGLSTCVTDALLLRGPTGVPQKNFWTDTAGVPDKDNPISGLLQPAVSGADSPTNRNSIVFPSVLLPANSNVTLRITNIRVVAPELSTINLGLPTQVIESISFLPQVQVSPSFQTVANVLPAMQFTVTACGDASNTSPATSFKQCTSVNADLFKDSSKTGTRQFNVKFTEGFGNAFKTQGNTTLTTPGVLSQINLYESGLTLLPPATAPGWDGATWTGLADKGTILRVNFKNIPDGLKVFVTRTPVRIWSGAVGTSELIDANLSIGTAVTGTTTCIGGTSDVGMAMAALKDGAAAWEVTASAVTTARSISFGVAIAYKADTSALLPALTGDNPMSVTGQLWPASTVAQASSSGDDKIPRFRDVQIAAGAVRILPCATTLLYPFITNEQGFETGIAISNTSLDNYADKKPLSTATQTGTCAVYFFNGSTTAPAPYTSFAEFKPGMVHAAPLTTMTEGAAFTGYAIASCTFQYAHGYAYIVDMGSEKIGAQGYLALIIPDTTSRAATAFDGSAGGEQLIF